MYSVHVFVFPYSFFFVYFQVLIIIITKMAGKLSRETPIDQLVGVANIGYY